MIPSVEPRNSVVDRIDRALKSFELQFIRISLYLEKKDARRDGTLGQLEQVVGQDGDCTLWGLDELMRSRSLTFYQIICVLGTQDFVAFCQKLIDLDCPLLL